MPSVSLALSIALITCLHFSKISVSESNALTRWFACLDGEDLALELREPRGLLWPIDDDDSDMLKDRSGVDGAALCLGFKLLGIT